MSYNEATLAAATGDILFIPGWIGYFFWNYELNCMMFRNGDYLCKADEFIDIQNRTDFIKII